MDKTIESAEIQNQPPRADVLLVTVADVQTRTVLAAAEKEVGHKCKPLYIGHKTCTNCLSMGHELICGQTAKYENSPCVSAEYC